MAFEGALVFNDCSAKRLIVMGNLTSLALKLLVPGELGTGELGGNDFSNWLASFLHLIYPPGQAGFYHTLDFSLKKCTLCFNHIHHIYET